VTQSWPPRKAVGSAAAGDVDAGSAGTRLLFTLGQGSFRADAFVAQRLEHALPAKCCRTAGTTDVCVESLNLAEPAGG
jgi:hypothetical protein